MRQAHEIGRPAVMTGGKLLLVVAGRQPLAIRVETVLRVHDELAVQPLEGTRSWFLGLAVAQGSLLPVTDLGRLLFGRPGKGQVLQIVSSIESVGLKVDTMDGFGNTVHESVDTSRDWPVGVSAHLCCNSHGNDYRLLDVATLIRSAEFCRIAEQSPARTP